MSVIVIQYITAPWNWSSDGVFLCSNKITVKYVISLRGDFPPPFSSGWRKHVLLSLVFKNRAGELKYALDVDV